jgi:hypothetical protein
MIRFIQPLILLGAFAFGALYTSFCYSADSMGHEPIEIKERCEPFEHWMKLYLADAYGVEVGNTAFWIKIIVDSEEMANGTTRVSLQLPSINFITGPFANNIYEINNPLSEAIDGEPGDFSPPPQNGGYLYTKEGFLPPRLRPNDVLTRSYFGPSNNGQNIPFNYVPNITPPPNVSNVTYNAPQAGYLIRITNSGGLEIEGIGTLANIIPPGSQQLLPTNITYFAKRQTNFIKNKRISEGAINVAQYGIPSSSVPVTRANVDYVRDFHVNDAFDNVVAYAWADNSNIPNAAENPNVMNLAYAIGKVENGRLNMRPAEFLPNPKNQYIWDTAIAINRTNKKNIVISYLLIDGNSPGDGQPFSVLYRAISYDGGKTWPVNGPTNIQPTGFIAPGIPGGAGDLPGVRADKFGNFWYMGTNFFDNSGNLTNVPFIMVSSDQGLNWELVYTFPYDDVTHVSFYDFPAFSFGGDGLGSYGVQIVVDFFPGAAATPANFNGYPSRAFIPVTGLGTFGTPSQANLPQLTNNIYTASIAASDDGKVWTYGSPSGLSPALYPFPGGFTNNRIVFKSPGPIDQNYAGPWGVVRFNSLADSLYIPVWKAAPVFGFFQSVQTNIYDNKRKALYVIFNATYPESSNNSEIYFLISRDNGLTWSNALNINDNNINNRGFPSMALDIKTGNLLIGWYDCRNYSDGLSFNYYGAVIDAKSLDELTQRIPESNPIFTIPAGGFNILSNIALADRATTISNDNKNRPRPHTRLNARLNRFRR